MVDSDVVIGWIGDDDTAYFHDRYAFQQQLPPIDAEQNWFLTNSEVENGYTQLEFYRQFVTCDELDREIHADTSRVVFSWNDNKPTVTTNPDDGSEDYSISQHQTRGSTSVNLLGGLPVPPDVPSDANTFIVGVDQVEIPAQETDYYCRGIQLDENIREEEQYIIKISPAISSDSAAYVHHMLVYICDGLEDEDLGAGGDCDTVVSSRVRNCLGSLLIAAWAVGGSDFIYPDNVAYPIGGPNDKQFAVIQIHYNNPNEDSGVIDSSGVQFTYIDTPREFDAGIMFLGHRVIPEMVIPPGSSNYTITAFCSDDCTQQYFPSEGIHIFANMLHTHLIGVGLELSVVDETTCSTGQSRVEQTQIVEKNLQYDFNFQQANHLTNDIIVKPGSTILLNCYYDSTSRSDATIGGESTTKEMCLSFPVYYPRTTMDHCTSQPAFNNFNGFIQDYVPEEYHEQFEELQPGIPEDTFITILGLIEWNDQQLDGLYNYVYQNGQQQARCGGDDNSDVTTEYPPELCCAYETANQCTGSTPSPCCDRTCLNVQGGAATVNSSVYLLLFGLLLLLVQLNFKFEFM